MEEDLDLLLTQFPTFSDTLKEDVTLHLRECPYCNQYVWVVSDYYFTCPCGGLSFYENSILRKLTSEEYEKYKMTKAMRRSETLGFA